MFELNVNTCSFAGTPARVDKSTSHSSAEEKETEDSQRSASLITAGIDEFLSNKHSVQTCLLFEPIFAGVSNMRQKLDIFVRVFLTKQVGCLWKTESVFYVSEINKPGLCLGPVCHAKTTDVFGPKADETATMFKQETYRTPIARSVHAAPIARSVLTPQRQAAEVSTAERVTSSSDVGGPTGKSGGDAQVVIVVVCASFSILAASQGSVGASASRNLGGGGAGRGGLRTDTDTAWIAEKSQQRGVTQGGNNPESRGQRGGARRFHLEYKIVRGTYVRTKCVDGRARGWESEKSIRQMMCKWAETNVLTLKPNRRRRRSWSRSRFLWNPQQQKISRKNVEVRL
ncbi:hypothetical protein B0H16DRAFT_1830574 [Mycena metata]|uniref:Uncharacterized protein n=1 Tax=Mycena metata TaxID=1033252 RepID=A0AAD7K7K8_9AGAR|nr:hypothetical protein B0H16DRAFT_1830574 [Mycena metata]